MPDANSETLAALSLDLVLRTVPSGLFLVDRDQRILTWNAEAERMTGYPAAEVIGQHCSILAGIPCGDRCGLFDPDVPKPIIGTRCSVLGRDGRRIVLFKNVDFLRDAAGRILGGIESFIDITELTEVKDTLRQQAADLEDTVRRRTRELEVERTELRDANRELDTFVSMVAHDLRAPLTPIIAYADFLQTQYASVLDGQAQEMLGEIEKHGQRILRVLEDLLILARLGHLPQPEVPVEATAVVREVLAELGEKVRQKKVEVKLAPLPPLNIPETFVFQLFSNLIGNALQYGAPVGSVVEVLGTTDAERVTIGVRDHGPGIPAEERTRLFDPFYRGSTARGNGTGIGLAIVRKIVRLYGGRIWIEDTLGGGATFWVEFPAAPGKR